MPKASKNYFIDLENIGNRWLELLGDIHSGDRIDIFYTNSGPSLHYTELERIMNCAAQVTLTRCTSGNNALDFQLATELGYRIAKNGETPISYVIVSNDGGFDAVVKYWRERAVSIKRYGIASAPAAAKPAAASVNPPSPPVPAAGADEQQAAQYLEILSRLQSISSKDAAQIAAILTETMREPPEKRAIGTYHRIVSAFGKKKGLTVYNQAKSTIVDIAKNGPFPPA